MKEIEEDTNKWEAIPHSRIEIINIVDMSIVSEVVYRFNSYTNYMIHLVHSKITNEEKE
jgi:hypothetical protein